VEVNGDILPDADNTRSIGSPTKRWKDVQTVTLGGHTVPAVAADTLALLDATQTLTNKTLSSPVIQGSVSAGTGLTMPGFTLAGTLDFNSQEVTNSFQTYRALVKESRRPLVTFTGWTSSVVGSAAVTAYGNRLTLTTGTTSGSSALAYLPAFGLSPPGYYWDRVDWATPLSVIGYVAREVSDANAVARLNLSNTPGGNLVGKGLGIKIYNLALYGESYGTARCEIDLATSLSMDVASQIEIRLTPGSKIEWFVDGALVGSTTDASCIPTGVGAGLFVLEIENGASAVNVKLHAQVEALAKE